MSRNGKRNGVPEGFNTALTEYPYGMTLFDTLTEKEKRAVIGGTHSAEIEEELRSMYDSLHGMKEPHGPIQL